MRKAYNFIWIKTEKEEKIAFRTRYDLYEYTIMAFKLINVSTSCQELFNDILQKYLNIFIEEHEQDIKNMLEYLSKQNLLIKLKKCNWHKKEINFLKFIIEINDVRMNSNKLISVKTWSVFTNVKEVQAFLEFVNYNRKFI